MGSPMSCSLACLYMGKLENDHVWNNNPFFEHISGWYRLIDDFFFCWSGELDEFQAFNEYMNSRSDDMITKLII